MPFFNATQAELAAGRHVNCPRLVFFDFAEEEIRLWEGSGSIVIDGETWLGAGELGSIGDTPFGQNDSAGNQSFTLSGVSPDIVAKARSSASVRGRAVTIYGRFLDADFAPIDDTFVIRELIMDNLQYSGVGPTERRITLTAEDIWTNRNTAAYAFYSDIDQQARFLGDLGCSFVPTLKNKNVTWPMF